MVVAHKYSSLLLLIFSGCASESLLEIAKACGPVNECQKEWDDYNRAEERKKEDKGCPGDMVVYRDNWGTRCVSRDAIKQLLESLRY